MTNLTAKILPFEPRRDVALDVEIRLRDIDRELSPLRGGMWISDEDLQRKADLLDERRQLMARKEGTP